MRTERRMAQTGLMGGEIWFMLAGLVCLGDGWVPLMFSCFLNLSWQPAQYRTKNGPNAEYNMLNTARRMAQIGLTGGAMWLMWVGVVCRGDNWVPPMFSQFLMTNCLRYHCAAYRIKNDSILLHGWRDLAAVRRIRFHSRLLSTLNFSR